VDCHATHVAEVIAATAATHVAEVNAPPISTSTDDDRGSGDATATTTLFDHSGGLWVCCDRCRHDRRLPANAPIPFGLWYCELHPDYPAAPHCEPTSNIPSRAPKVRAPVEEHVVDMSGSVVEEMVDAFPRLKTEAKEQELLLRGGWVATYKKRKRGDGGDVYLTREGDKPLRSVMDVRRLYGLH